MFKKLQEKKKNNSIYFYSTCNLKEKIFIGALYLAAPAVSVADYRLAYPDTSSAVSLLAERIWNFNWGHRVFSRACVCELEPIEFVFAKFINKCGSLISVDCWPWSDMVKYCGRASGLNQVKVDPIYLLIRTTKLHQNLYEFLEQLNQFFVVMFMLKNIL